MITSKIQNLSPWFYALLAVLVSLLPLVVFLFLSYQDTLAKVQEQLDFLTQASIARSDQVLSVVQNHLSGLVRNRIVGCTPYDRGIYGNLVYNTIQIRNIGVFDGNQFLCTDLKKFEPPIIIPAKDADDLELSDIGEIAIVGPKTDLRDQQSIFINYNIDGKRFINSAIYPEQFWDFQEFLQLGDSGGVFLLNRHGNTISKLHGSHLQLPQIKLTSQEVDDQTLISRDKTFFVARKSKIFPVVAIAGASQDYMLRTWRKNLNWALLMGLIGAISVGWLAWYLARRSYQPAHELKMGLAQHQLSLVYQPIVDMRDQQVLGVEALLRWYHPQRGWVSPLEFIRVAEQYHLMNPLTRYVIQEAIRDMTLLLSQNPNLYLSLNICLTNLLDETTLEDLEGFISKGVRYPQIQLEITEREFLPEQLELVRSRLAKFEEKGMILAMDDFGTGYSNLAYLKHFPLSVMKIDRIFISLIDRDELQSNLTNEIIHLGKSLQLKLIAEGVETEMQAQALIKQGVYYAQGWLYAKAMPLEQFKVYLAEHSRANIPLEV
jgi:sensor c-di-GMP phosphodiesterase-like protein